jgi:ribosomal subunit interface protein
MEIRITSRNLGLSSQCQQFIEKKMRAIRRFVADGVSAQVFLRRNAGTVPGKRFSARARLTIRQGKLHGFCANAHLNVAVRQLVAKLARQARKGKRRRVDAVRRIDKASHRDECPYEPVAETAPGITIEPPSSASEKVGHRRGQKRPKKLACLRSNTTLT